ncbi:MAG: tetrathionate reductase family octaheme c-type cytochrome [Anaerolineae bacterium]|nr:tetrathionate reductase family octaheme c-type cytochrome [Anaerolineae bacterium]
MKNFKYLWMIGLGVTILVIVIPIILFATPDAVNAARDPWASVPKRNPAVSHASLIGGEFTTGQQVTQKCLECHADAASQVIHTTHWTWESAPVVNAVSGEEVTIGKKNTLNNFCIGIQSNWSGCTKCHAGYGWQDATFDFTNTANVDCLVCHDQTGTYLKGTAGNVADGVDLLAVAQSVGTPTRANCGGCHFNGGGGNGVKHGDLDSSLYFPSATVDVHMGEFNMQCVDCHKTEDHLIKGRAMSVSFDNTNQVACTDCHDKATTHTDTRITSHLDTVACQTCHIPTFAKQDPTKVEWDWSQAGQDLPEDPHSYLKIKGSFVYDTDIVPTYTWFNGTSRHYLIGDPMDPNQTTVMSQPLGNINDDKSLIFPFKLHYAKQPYDTLYNYLLQPKTVGEGGYWTTFDWNSSLEAGSEAAGIAYSGKYGFAPTLMYWPITHMVAPKTQALQCTDCHGETGRIDWQTLGYPGDPMVWGGRK